MTELAKRILFAVPAALLFLYLVWTGGPGLFLFLSILSLLGLFEMTRMFSRMSSGVSLLLALGAGLLVWMSELVSFEILVWPAGLLVAVGLFSLIRNDKISAKRRLVSLFSGLYVPAGFFFLWKLRQAGDPETGFWLALSLLLVIWANDIFAYLGGRQFGRRPLALEISPKKTWEGFWSGFLGSVAVMVLIVFCVEDFPLSIPEALPLVAGVACLGPAGDLMVSRLKRLADLKDSSKLLPGHGGILDRFDSLLLSAPFFYLYVIRIV
ncbi:MAG: phosphatidate cytidylyltransferase [Balneolaceae bacterium]